MRKKSFNKKLLRFCIRYLFLIGIWVFFIGAILIAYYSRDIPNINELSKGDKIINNLSINYSNQQLIRTYGTVSNNSIVYSDLPKYLVDALIATEDRRFFDHNGVDIFGIMRALYTNYKVGYIKEGGSSITQQLAKMMFLSRKRTIKRKVQEAMLATKLEKIFSKEQIVAFYLNKAYFGAGKYGIKDAAKFYFNKNISELNLEESAMLIGLLKAPSKYSPTNNPELAKKRTDQIIINMQKAGLIKKEDVNEYLKENLEYTYSDLFNKQNQSYYFADWVKSQIYDYVDDDNNNISVKTTFEAELQKTIENVTYNFVEDNNEKLGKTQIALVAMSKDGAVLAMLGGKSYDKSPFNRSLYAYRQPGSAFKLFVFLTGLKKGFGINDIFIDEPIAIGDWYPENYNKKYYGRVSMKEAFAKSLNSVAIQLSELCGIKDVVKTTHKLGITSKIDTHDPTIALGSIQVNLLELTAAYATILNDGYPVIPHFISEIKDNEGGGLYQRQSSGLNKIIEKKHINNIKEMMFEVIDRGTGKNAGVEKLIKEGKGIKNKFLFKKGNYKIGGKTGTSQDYRDAWFIGYAEDLVIGIWMGNDDNTPTNKIVGGSLPARLWREIVENIVYYK